MRRQFDVVGDEVSDLWSQLFFDHRMSSATNLDAGQRRHVRRVPFERRGALGECRQHVDRGQRRCRALQHGNRGLERLEDLLEQQLLARQRSVPRRQRLVLERLQLGRDVALGVLQRLPASIVIGHFRRLRVGDLDVETMDAIELDLEIGNAGPRALALFHREQECAGIGRDRAELVERGVVAVSDDAAFAQHRRWLGRDRAR